MKLYATTEEVRRKYRGRYVEIYEHQDGSVEVWKVSKVIRENMTRGEDVGTPEAYTR